MHIHFLCFFMEKKSQIFPLYVFYFIKNTAKQRKQVGKKPVIGNKECFSVLCCAVLCNFIPEYRGHPYRTTTTTNDDDDDDRGTRRYKYTQRAKYNEVCCQKGIFANVFGEKLMASQVQCIGRVYWFDIVQLTLDGKKCISILKQKHEKNALAFRKKKKIAPPTKRVGSSILQNA